MNRLFSTGTPVSRSCYVVTGTQRHADPLIFKLNEMAKGLKIGYRNGECGLVSVVEKAI